MHGNVIFTVTTNELLWTNENIPENTSIVYLEKANPDINMAILVSCNHFIIQLKH